MYLAYKTRSISKKFADRYLIRAFYNVTLVAVIGTPLLYVEQIYQSQQYLLRQVLVLWGSGGTLLIIFVPICMRILASLRRSKEDNGEGDGASPVGLGNKHNKRNAEQHGDVSTFLRRALGQAWYRSGTIKMKKTGGGNAAAAVVAGTGAGTVDGGTFRTMDDDAAKDNGLANFRSVVGLDGEIVTTTTPSTSQPQPPTRSIGNVPDQCSLAYVIPVLIGKKRVSKDDKSLVGRWLHGILSAGWQMSLVVVVRSQALGYTFLSLASVQPSQNLEEGDQVRMEDIRLTSTFTTIIDITDCNVKFPHASSANSPKLATRSKAADDDDDAASKLQVVIKDPSDGARLVTLQMSHERDLADLRTFLRWSGTSSMAAVGGSSNQAAASSAINGSSSMEPPAPATPTTPTTVLLKPLPSSKRFHGPGSKLSQQLERD